MNEFFLQKNFAKPGETIEIKGDCVFSGSEFLSSDKDIATITNPNIVNVVGIGEVNISQSGSFCYNSGILLTSTEDGKPFFISPSQYNQYTNYEIILLISILVVAFIIKFGKRW